MEEEALLWRLGHIEGKSDKLEEEVKAIGLEVTVIKTISKRISDDNRVQRNTFIAFVITNVLMYLFTNWNRIIGG